MLRDSYYLNHTRPTGRTLLSVVRSLSESGLKAAQKPCTLKRARMALKSILIFRNETTLPRRTKRVREHDRRE